MVLWRPASLRPPASILFSPRPLDIAQRETSPSWDVVKPAARCYNPTRAVALTTIVSPGPYVGATMQYSQQVGHRGRAPSHAEPPAVHGLVPTMLVRFPHHLPAPTRHGLACCSARRGPSLPSAWTSNHLRRAASRISETHTVTRHCHRSWGSDAPLSASEGGQKP
jgi:hypothetical protein